MRCQLGFAAYLNESWLNDLIVALRDNEKFLFLELPIDKIKAMCDDLIEAHGDWLPKYR